MYKKFLLTLISILLLSFNAIAASDGELKLSENEKPKKIKDCFEKLNRATFSFNQGLDKTIFKRQNYDEEIKMEIFEDKVTLNSPNSTMLGKMILDFERHSENIGLLHVRGFNNNEVSFRNIMFSKNELTSVTIFTPNVFISSYNCTPNF